MIMMLKKAFNIIPLPLVRIALFLSFLPRDLEMIEPEPTPIIIPTANMSICMGNTIARPAIARGPTPWPTYSVSTTLYKALTTSPTVAGIENLNNNFLKLPFKINSLSSMAKIFSFENEKSFKMTLVASYSMP